jgi:cytochrome c oxidase subunit 4
VRLVLTWLGLMLLLALTLGSSYVPLGPWNTAINMAVSCAKALLIALIFMELGRAGALVRIAAVTGLVWLALLFGLSATDYATRAVSPAPWQAPGP